MRDGAADRELDGEEGCGIWVVFNFVVVCRVGRSRVQSFDTSLLQRPISHSNSSRNGLIVGVF